MKKQRPTVKAQEKQSERARPKAAKRKGKRGTSAPASEIARGEHGPEGGTDALPVRSRHRAIDGGGQEAQRAHGFVV